MCTFCEIVLRWIPQNTSSSGIKPLPVPMLTQIYVAIPYISGFAPSQWETLLQSNAVSHWLGANLESVLNLHREKPGHNEFSQISHQLSDFWWIVVVVIMIFITSISTEGSPPHEQRSKGLTGKRAWRCTSTGQDGSNELDLEWISPVVLSYVIRKVFYGRTDGGTETIP